MNAREPRRDVRPTVVRCRAKVSILEHQRNTNLAQQTSQCLRFAKLNGSPIFSSLLRLARLDKSFAV